MSIKLLPCPFCGSEAHLDKEDIFCDCGANISIDTIRYNEELSYIDAKQEAVDRWNRRTQNVDS